MHDDEITRHLAFKSAEYNRDMETPDWDEDYPDHEEPTILTHSSAICKNSYILQIESYIIEEETYTEEFENGTSYKYIPINKRGILSLYESCKKVIENYEG